MNTTAVQVFVSVFVPIVLIGGAGYAIGRAHIVEQTQPLSRLCVYVLLPALAFTAMAQSDLGGRELGILVAFAWIIAGLQALVGRLIASRLTLDPLTVGAVLLSSVTVNAGNYGIPLNQFAFGPQAVSRAAVYYLATLVVTYVGGAIVGAGGGGVQHAAHRILTLPVVYAGLVGVALNTGGVVLPEPMMRSAHLLATAAAPVMLTLLGIELSRARVRHGEPALIAACALKLLVAPILAFGLAWTMGLDGVTRNVAIVQSSMPTAVGAAVMAVEFNARPAFVGSAILVTTLGSVVTLATLLMVLEPLR